jgi:glyoxylase-like metal-dependent hydrolase (beta-lactamase superfamily II)
MLPLTRRSFVAASLGAGIATALPRQAAAVPPVQGPGAYTFKLGDYRIVALYDGTWDVPVGDGFIRNATAAAVDRALAAAFLPPRILPVSFTALLVDTGTKLILIDTGTAGQLTDSAGFMNANLAAVGIAPAQIDTILISHFHPDHIDGIKTKDGGKVFPNAEIWVPEPEWAYWMNDANMTGAAKPLLGYFLNARRIFKDIAGDVRRFKPGAEAATGIVSIPAYGHTPGHTAFAIHSAGQSLLAMGDAVRNPYLFVRHPEWQPSFDMDGPGAAKTRKAMLDRAAAGRVPMHAYHFPFPATGHIAKAGTRYEFVPAEWRPL